MTLGKNMKVEKLIPSKPKKKESMEASAKKEGVEEFKTSDKLDDAQIVSDKLVDTKTKMNEINSNEDTNVDLDTFFNKINGEPKSKGDDVSSDSEVLELDNLTGSGSKGLTSQENQTDVKDEKSETFIKQDIETETIKIVFKPSRRKTQKRIFIDIEGEATIKNADLLYSNVNDVFEHFDHIEINMSNIKKVDLSVIQLFHMIRVNYFPQNKFIYLNADFNREDRKLLTICGFTEFQTQKVAQN